MSQFTPAQDHLMAFLTALDLPFPVDFVQAVHIDGDSSVIRILHFVEEDGRRKRGDSGEPAVEVYSIVRRKTWIGEGDNAE